MRKFWRATFEILALAAIFVTLFAAYIALSA